MRILRQFIDTLKELCGRGAQTISFSRIKTYRFCPLKYQLVYERGWKETQTGPGALGQSLHRALERFHLGQVGTIDELIGFLDEVWVHAGYRSSAEEIESRAHAEELLRRYHQWWERERPHILCVEKEFRFRVGRVMLQGIIDRIDRDPTGRCGVVEYKTRVNQSDFAAGRYDLQLGIYQRACAEICGQKAAPVTLHCLTTGARFTKSFTKEQMNTVCAEIEQVGKEIVRKNFAPDLSQCVRCQFSKSCPKQ